MRLDASKLNPKYKGSLARVAPLFDIYDGGKQKGFTLQIRLPGKKQFRNNYLPLHWDTREEAQENADIFNLWAKKPS